MSARVMLAAACLLTACSSRKSAVNGAADASSGAGGAAVDSSIVDTSTVDVRSDQSALDSSPGGAGGAGGSSANCSAPKLAGLDTAGVPPALLSQTGLYADLPSETFAGYVRAFEPAYKLWSDGALKRRWVYLPDCPIDTHDMDHWSLPVGTKFWKEFTVDGVRVETRMIERFGPGPRDVVFAAYQWRADGSDADYVPAGVRDANGTQHDIPALSDCQACHGYLPEHALGFSAIQLSHQLGGVTLDTLAAEGRLTVAPQPGGYPVPGDSVTSSALGYLHANCGHCHNDSGIVFNRPYRLRLLVSQTAPSETDVYATAVGVPVEKFVHPGITNRVTPGDPGTSCISYRMGVRGTTEQMPPFATEVVDSAGKALVDAWISSLPL